MMSKWIRTSTKFFGLAWKQHCILKSILKMDHVTYHLWKMWNTNVNAANFRPCLRSFCVTFRNFQVNRILNIKRILEKFFSKVTDFDLNLWIIRILGSSLRIFFVTLNINKERERNAKGTRALIFVIAVLSRSLLKIRNAFLSRSSLLGTRSSNACLV